MPTEWYLACLTPLVVYRGINQVTTEGEIGGRGEGCGGGGGTSGLHGPGTE